MLRVRCISTLLGPPSFHTPFSPLCKDTLHHPPTHPHHGSMGWQSSFFFSLGCDSTKWVPFFVLFCFPFVAHPIPLPPLTLTLTLTLHATFPLLYLLALALTSLYQHPFFYLLLFLSSLLFSSSHQSSLIIPSHLSFHPSIQPGRCHHYTLLNHPLFPLRSSLTLRTPIHSFHSQWITINNQLLQSHFFIEGS